MSYFSADEIRSCGYSYFRHYKKFFDERLHDLQYVYDYSLGKYRKKTSDEVAALSHGEQEILAELLTLVPVFKEVNKTWTDRKKNCLADFSSDEALKEWVQHFSPENPAAVVSNRWEYAMGSIGSTSATIVVGKGKEKPLRRHEVPSWTPVGYVTWRERMPSWMGGTVKCEKVIRSWDDVFDALSGYENQTITLYKSPK